MAQEPTAIHSVQPHSRKRSSNLSNHSPKGLCPRGACGASVGHRSPGLVAAWFAAASLLTSVLSVDDVRMDLTTALQPQVLAQPWLVNSQPGKGTSAPFSPLVLVLSAVPFASVGWLFAAAVTGSPYCESCGRWADRFAPFAWLSKVSTKRLRVWIEEWDLQTLIALPRASDDDHVIDVLEAARCPTCSEFAVSVRTFSCSAFVLVRPYSCSGSRMTQNRAC